MNIFSARLKILLFMAVIVSVIVSMIAGFGINSNLFAQSKQSKVEEDYYYSLDKKIHVSIPLDQIGILAREGVTAGKIKEFVTSFKLKLVREFPGGMFILSLEKPLTRAELVKFARDIKRRGEKLLRDAGLVIISKDDHTPMIVTDVFIVLFKADVKKDQIDAFNKSNNVVIVSPDPFVKNQFLIRVTEASRLDALKMANKYHESHLSEFSHPNFWVVYDRFETIPNDSFFGNQWHHRNTGQNGGTVDADADTSLAWDITMGSSNIVIAVIDNGFDLVHEDLAPNLFTNPGEIAGNNMDDDGNGFVDDVNGWDFIGNDNNPGPVAAGDNHGTSVTGVAVARANNQVVPPTVPPTWIGVAGSCPNCRFIPINVFSNCAVGGGGCTSNAQAFANAIGYAQALGAQIINNSWGQTNPNATALAVVVNAINNAAASGSIIFFAAGNQGSAGWCTASYPSLANVIAVSSSSNQDRKVTGHAFGNCIDILSPTRWGVSDPTPTGTLAVTTTDRTGAAGYNNTDPVCIGGITEPANTNYTNCFSGTSSATPLTAGIAGLILSTNPSLTRVQVQRLLQDTTDKIEDSIGTYNSDTGFSTPATGTATHSWGRINAFEAVRVAAPVAQGGKNGVDIFLRDNRLDWGNTEQPSNTLFEPTRGFIGHWQSTDIKVDAFPYQTPPTAATFDAFVDETPSAVPGQINKVYVRVRNRGPVTANSVTVKLHWTQFGTALPALPSDFWTAFPANSTDTSQWHPLNCSGSSSSTCIIANLAYSGSSEAGCPGRTQPPCGWDLNGDGDTADPGETPTDAVQIVSFDFPAPPVDPMLPDHFCLLAMVDSPQDQISPNSKATFVVDSITPTENNVTHRNYTGLSTSTSTNFVERFFVRNPTDKIIRTVLRLSAPKGWRIDLDKFGFDKPFKLEPKQEAVVIMKVALPELGQEGDVIVTQEQIDGNKTKPIGGLSYRLRPEKATKAAFAGSTLSSYLIGTFDLRDGGKTIIHVLNPTAKNLKVITSFFDDNEKPLKCIHDRLSPNDLLEIDALKHKPGAKFGVVKVVALNEDNAPELGIAGYQRHFFGKGGVTEAILHPVPKEILLDDFKFIWKVCK